MALEKVIEYDKVEVVGEYQIVQVRKATVIKEDGKELNRSFHRYMLEPGTLDSSNNLVDTDLSAQPNSVKNICNSVWTTDVKNAWKDYLIKIKNEQPR
tara:strand:- start:54 stop:347 length:294 start_codon:yes stop_codon:yes gene_type:complete